MSLEFEELEEPLSRLGALILFISSFIISILLIIASMSVQGTGDIFGINVVQLRYQLVTFFIFFLIVSILAILCLARKYMKRKINVFYSAIVAHIFFCLLIIFIPSSITAVEELTTEALRYNNVLTAIQVFIWIGIGGNTLIFISKRPNLGKESDKHIYQAYGAFVTFTVGLFLIFLGLLVIYFDISQYAGHGTFPGGFYETYIVEYDTVRITYEAIRWSGLIIVISGLIICGASVVRNIISLNVAAIVILIAIVIGIVGIGYFFQSWQLLDSRFLEKYPDVYQAQLTLSDPRIVNIGVVLIMHCFIGFFMIVYASSQSEPLEKWRTKRNHFLAAAEVAIRDQKLQKAIKYLEQASIWSSKLGEEDKAVELITKINNIKEKAIKMRKAEAAEKKKRELEAAKKAAEKKAPKALKKE
ncbi:MAG: hypothetical protein ACTSQJ_05085 [Promethearchaeota archaeon]